ncbi:hypothetical protein [Roseateles terrae]|uniref:GNAT superfamily N-acetyltransferase n=1 Tax=Roseateles terrae TaxID=431060 RepID=A0ABR6GVU1_9BURK|nr:hypothetical protein [Roseateles terrae]MBB3196165.1 GNAT superfamily N-acetyltransferase [Roseateles terrae]OWQ85375.1 hypothetical protein CDN98_15695 [Roseateles terrae]
MVNRTQPPEDFPARTVDVRFTGRVDLDVPVDLRPVCFNGKDITHRLWELAGAFDGSRLTVSRLTVGTEHGQVEAIKLKVCHDVLLALPMQRWLYSVDDGQAWVHVIENVEFYLREEYRGQGIGRISLLTEALAANDLLFDKIIAIAAGSPQDQRHVGWKVWPKLGYDAVIAKDILDRMPPHRLSRAGIDPTSEVRISDLLDQGLYDLWVTHGEGCIMELDVRSLSTWSMQRLADFDEE